MQDYIQKRVLDISNYIIESSATVRQTASVFGVSKSTVHKEVTTGKPPCHARCWLKANLDDDLPAYAGHRDNAWGCRGSAAQDAVLADHRRFVGGEHQQRPLRA